MYFVEKYDCKAELQHNIMEDFIFSNDYHFNAEQFTLKVVM